jgi:flagellar hook assembly protein FlgD
MPAGVHVVIWDGRDSAGGEAAPGIYFAQVSSGKETRTKKLLLVR